MYIEKWGLRSSVHEEKLLFVETKWLLFVEKEMNIVLVPGIMAVTFYLSWATRYPKGIARTSWNEVLQSLSGFAIPIRFEEGIKVDTSS